MVAREGRAVDVISDKEILRSIQPAVDDWQRVNLPPAVSERKAAEADLGGDSVGFRSFQSLSGARGYFQGMEFPAASGASKAVGLSKNEGNRFLGSGFGRS